MPPRDTTLDPIEDITRRRLLTALPGLALVAGGIACGDDDGDAEPADGSGAPATFTTSDLFGEVTAPTDPERVIAGDSATLGNMLALGVTPVGAAVNRMSLPTHLASRMQNVEAVTAEDNSGVDLEKAATLNPDLIVTYGGLPERPFNEENCGRYRDLAPTFCYQYGYATEEELKRNLTEVARILGRDSDAQALIAAYDARVEDLRARVVATGLDSATVSVVRVLSTEYYVAAGTTESVVLRDIGIPRPENQSDYTQFGFSLSLERLSDIEADAIFIYVDSDANNLLAPLIESPLYDSLSAVQDGRVFFVSSGIWNSEDIIGAMLILDDIERSLIIPAEAAQA